MLYVGSAEIALQRFLHLRELLISHVWPHWYVVFPVGETRQVKAFPWFAHIGSPFDKMSVKRRQVVQKKMCEVVLSKSILSSLLSCRTVSVFSSSLLSCRPSTCGFNISIFWFSLVGIMDSLGISRTSGSPSTPRSVLSTSLCADLHLSSLLRACGYNISVSWSSLFGIIDALRILHISGSLSTSRSVLWTSLCAGLHFSSLLRV